MDGVGLCRFPLARRPNSPNSKRRSNKYRATTKRRRLRSGKFSPRYRQVSSISFAETGRQLYHMPKPPVAPKLGARSKDSALEHFLDKWPTQAITRAHSEFLMKSASGCRWAAEPTREVRG